MSSVYQVQCEWGDAAVTAFAKDILVVADYDRGASGDAARAATDALVLEATLDNSAEIAAAVIAEQTRLGTRAFVTVVLPGDSWPDGSLRPSTADYLIAGRVVDALAASGIDFHSPSAAAACAAAVALRGATNHLISAERAARSEHA